MSEYLSQRIRYSTPMWLSMNSPRSQRFMAIVTLRRWTSGITPLSRSSACPVRPCSYSSALEPAAEWLLPTNIGRDADGYLLTVTDVLRSGSWPRTDRDPCPMETTVPGILAAGDVRSGSTKRVGFAVGSDSSCAGGNVRRSLAVDQSLNYLESFNGHDPHRR